LQRGDLEALAAANVSAGDHVISPHHVGLRLGKARTVPVIGVARQLSPLAPDYPTDLVIAWLATVRTDQCVCSLLIGFGKKFAFFHNWVNSRFRYEEKYSILSIAMTKRKKEKFSVTKAVKSNARDVVGQPKPSRVVEDKPKPEGRESKHKPSLEQITESGE
jgi:hypothetical protein